MRFITSPTNEAIMRTLRASVHPRWEQALRWTIFLAVVSLVGLTLATGTTVGYEPDTRSIDELDGGGSVCR